MTEPTVTPAPATLVTDSAVTPPIVIPAAPVTPTAPAAPAAPAPTVAAPATPVTPAPAADSPEALAAAKRVQDAQAKMHLATTEASKLRTQLDAIINHPLLGPVARQVTQIPAQPQPDESIEKAWKDYQSAPSDKDAFAKLMQHASELTYERLKREAQERRVQQANAAQAQKRDTAIAQFINETVSKDAPDVPLDLFWAMSQRAESETPVTLVDLPSRLEWQVGRAIELSRDLLKPKAAMAAENTTTAAAVNRAAGAVMPAGGTTPSIASGTVGKVPTMVDQIKAVQARKYIGKV